MNANVQMRVEVKVDVKSGEMLELYPKRCNGLRQVWRVRAVRGKMPHVK